MTLLETESRDWRGPVLVLLAAMLAYGASLLGTFVYDDIHSVSANPAITELGNIGRFFVDPTLFSATGNNMYRPVLLTSFALDHAIGGGAAWVFKLQSLLLHALCSMLLLLLGRAHGLRGWPMLAAALLFAVHPLASEAVNLVSARSELLLLFGLLLGLHGHLRLLANRRSGWPLMLLGTVVACGSKETGVVLPLLLGLQEWLLLPRQQYSLEAGFVVGRRRQFGAAVQRLLPVVVLVGGYLLARRAMFGSATIDLGRGHDGSDPMSGYGRDPLTQLATMATLLPRALLQMLVPVGLSLDPPVRFHHGFDWQALCGLGGLLLLTGIGLWRPRRRPLRSLGIAMAWLAALPWIIVPLNVPLSEHRLYGVMAACLLALADVVAVRVAQRSVVVVEAGDAALPAAPRQRLGKSTFVTVLLVFMVLSGRRSLDYRDERTLWQDILDGRPQCFRAQWGLGLAMLRHGDNDGAIAHLATAAALYPQNPSPRIEWLQCLLRLPTARGKPFLAQALAEQLVAERPDDPYCRILLANTELGLGEATGDATWFARAEASAMHCLRIGSPKGLVYRTAARARQLRGDVDGALALLDTSIARGLDHVSVRIDRAELLRLCGRSADADAELQRAMQQDPMDPSVQAAVQRLRTAAPPR